MVRMFIVFGGARELMLVEYGYMFFVADFVALLCGCYAYCAKVWVLNCKEFVMCCLWVFMR